MVQMWAVVKELKKIYWNPKILHAVIPLIPYTKEKNKQQVKHQQTC
jgi:hypothetical protein